MKQVISVRLSPEAIAALDEIQERYASSALNYVPSRTTIIEAAIKKLLKDSLVGSGL